MTKLINDKGALNMQMYNEYQQKEREAFEAWLKSLNENDRTTYFLGQESTVAWEAWQAAKAQAVPDTYTPIVLALESVQAKIAKTSFLTMDVENENEIYAVDANELHEYIAELIEAQEPAND